MSEQETSFRDARRIAWERKAGNRSRAAETFEAARKLAESHGLILEKMSECHYVLIYERRWKVDFYPDVQWVFNPPDRPGWPERGPYIDVGACESWTLVDVVGAAVERLGS